MATGFLVSDLHGDSGRWRKLFALLRTERPEGLFLAGDLFPRPRGMAPERFAAGVLGAGLLALREELVNEYPHVFLVPGNLDPPDVEEVLAPLEADGLVIFAHGRKAPFGEFEVYGYGCVPPTPFSLKAWERFDVARALEPGCTAPEETDATIERDLADLTRHDELSRAILLLHTPPYGTKLDRIGRTSLDHAGSVAVRRLVEMRRPAVVLCGHIHESPRLSGSWADRIGPSVLFSAAHEGPELAVVAFDPARPLAATRRLL